RSASSTVSGRRMTTSSCSGGGPVTASYCSPVRGRARRHRMRYPWPMGSGSRWLLLAVAPLLVFGAASAESPVPVCQRPILVVLKPSVTPSPAGSGTPFGDDAAEQAAVDDERRTGRI